MVRIVTFIFLSTFLVSQEIDWNEKPTPITAIHIFCDTEGIPIFVDGIQVGASPVKDPVQVAPGWHQVSYFPPELTVSTRSIAQNRKMRDMIKLARQDVLVEEGKTIRVVLSYRSIEAEAMEYERKLSSSRWVGLGMVFTVFSLIAWGLM
ncbi:MAG: hypothetical protein ISR82_06530 [Candidatus Marinimicrobia bacterium]|nr:hypothetical protein [Candidatus Neomarinimicrobiota bacterium]MBL7010861.1 hypothetical protein [Candidatus Neomarinimicrobiota bacterium]MBL7030238.1 hypothetical protein [Candidatus Neomarinimicrobiota bacterium]